MPLTSSNTTALTEHPMPEAHLGILKSKPEGNT